jgi:hypothetical protein
LFLSKLLHVSWRPKQQRDPASQASSVGHWRHGSWRHDRAVLRFTAPWRLHITTYATVWHRDQTLSNVLNISCLQVEVFIPSTRILFEPVAGQVECCCQVILPWIVCYVGCWSTRKLPLRFVLQRLHGFNSTGCKRSRTAPK